MPERRTIRRAKAKKRAGTRTSTAAGDFVREEMHHKRQGKHPVTSRKQAIAIGLSEARRAGLNVPAKPRTRSRTTKNRGRRPTKR